MDWIKELTPLVEARGISGDEQQVAQVIRQRLPQGWKAHSDALGNLIVRYGCCAETPAGRRLLMVSAHMDEPGLLVTDIGEKGQVYFTVAGEIDEQVLAGETLISGTVRLESAPYSADPYMGSYQVRASGQVWARTWRTLTARIPLEAQVKAYTGEEYTRWIFTCFGRDTVFSGKGGISFDRYDKISRTWTLTLPGGEEMPLAVQRETCRAYELETLAVEPDAAEAMLKERLLEALEEAVGEGEIVSTEFAVETENGMLTVTLQAECREEIGTFVPESTTQEHAADP